MDFLKSFLYYAFIILVVLYIALVAFSPEKMMDVVGFRTLVVLSPSMEPKLMEKDMIITRKVAEEDLEVGDIITFSVYIRELGQEELVTHYLSAIETNGTNTYYRSRRYSLPEGESDEWLDDDLNPINITFDDIEGKYLFKIPYVGYLQDALQNKVILALILVNGFVIYLIVKQFSRDKDEDLDEE